jgi:hypothetical protein
MLPFPHATKLEDAVDAATGSGSSTADTTSGAAASPAGLLVEAALSFLQAEPRTLVMTIGSSSSGPATSSTVFPQQTASATAGSNRQLSISANAQAKLVVKPGATPSLLSPARIAGNFEAGIDKTDAQVTSNVSHLPNHDDDTELLLAVSPDALPALPLVPLRVTWSSMGLPANAAASTAAASGAPKRRTRSRHSIGEASDAPEATPVQLQGHHQQPHAGYATLDADTISAVSAQLSNGSLYQRLSGVPEAGDVHRATGIGSPSSTADLRRQLQSRLSATQAS